MLEAWVRGSAPVPADDLDTPRLLAQLMMTVFDGLFFSAFLDDGSREPAVFSDLVLGLVSAALA